MPIQFGRNYKLDVTSNLSQKTISITDLKMDFKLSRNTDSMSGKGTVSIYNLNKETREALTVISNKDGTPNLFIDLQVGYGDELATVLRGKAVGYHTWKPPSAISTFEVLDGVFEQTTAKFSADYKKLDTVDNAINDLLNAVGLPRGQVDIIGERFPKKRAYNGNPKTILEQLASDHNFRYVVQNSEQNIIKNSSSASVLSTYLLSASSGLIGIPYQKGTYLCVEALINPQLRVNDWVSIRSERLDRSLNGTYRIIEMSMSGGTFSNNWTMKLTLAIEDVVTQYIGTYDYIDRGTYDG